MELGLSGKVALVTGSSRGIGRSIALAPAAEGCNQVVTGRDAGALDEVAASVRHEGVKAAVAALDLCAAGAAATLVETARGEFGGLDIGGVSTSSDSRGRPLIPTFSPHTDAHGEKEPAVESLRRLLQIDDQVGAAADQKRIGPFLDKAREGCIDLAIPESARPVGPFVPQKRMSASDLFVPVHCRVGLGVAHE
jgi:NAD(P)-dependent dehydrogenase (short-subunit alcohol dehydrogenase family)